MKWQMPDVVAAAFFFAAIVASFISTPWHALFLAVCGLVVHGFTEDDR